MNWQPIETCPMDEKPMDIWSTKYGRCPDMVRVDGGKAGVWWQSDTRFGDHKRCNALDARGPT